jgi:hypothetical protein
MSQGGSSGKMLYYFVDLYTNLVVFRTLQVTHPYRLSDALPANNDDMQFLPGSSGKMLYYFVDLFTNLVAFSGHCR